MTVDGSGTGAGITHEPASKIRIWTSWKGVVGLRRERDYLLERRIWPPGIETLKGTGIENSIAGRRVTCPPKNTA